MCIEMLLSWQRNGLLEFFVLFCFVHVYLVGRLSGVQSLHQTQRVKVLDDRHSRLVVCLDALIICVQIKNTFLYIFWGRICMQILRNSYRLVSVSSLSSLRPLALPRSKHRSTQIYQKQFAKYESRMYIYSLLLCLYLPSPSTRRRARPWAGSWRPSGDSSRPGCPCCAGSRRWGTCPCRSPSSRSRAERTWSRRAQWCPCGCGPRSPRPPWSRRVDARRATSRLPTNAHSRSSLLGKRRRRRTTIKFTNSSSSSSFFSCWWFTRTSTMRAHWVPLPAPGPPSTKSTLYKLGGACASASCGAAAGAAGAAVVTGVVSVEPIVNCCL